MIRSAKLEFTLVIDWCLRLRISDVDLDDEIDDENVIGLKLYRNSLRAAELNSDLRMFCGRQRRQVDLGRMDLVNNFSFQSPAANPSDPFRQPYNQRKHKFQGSPSQFLAAPSPAHDLRDLNHVIERYVAAVLNVLHLLTITFRLLQRFDDQTSGGRDDGDLRLTILDGELDGDSESLPVLGGFLRYVFSDLLWRETEWTDLRSE
ncbi:hypothetical protein L1987_04686 [Smallanthus sonchifolius]|uniref:Uncharacterized protein n=1 Tax=Smallanthus sonchifolius TaxID=185202 RepID=A0ACB9JTE1_9ASTR|nr:hypothetical protein L1987_04686 [Smallanthus sonchifolius]